MTRQQRPVIGLGEILWDCFPDDRRPGGAPANFAFHARQLDLNGTVCSRVGTDPLGDQFREHLRQHGLSDQYVQVDPLHETGRVTIELDEQRQPSYTFVPDVAWDFLEFTEDLEQLMKQASAVCFGTLAQRNPTSRETIGRCLQSTPNDCLTVYDVNIRKPWFEASWIDASLKQADVVKLNHEEVQLVGQLLDLPTSLADFAEGLQTRYGVNLVCVTCGEDGCWLATPQEQAAVGGEPIQLADPVGAGDSFTAAMIAAQLAKWELPRTASFANRVAGLVASRQGAMPDLRDELTGLRSEFPG